MKINNQILDELKEMEVQDYEIKDLLMSRIKAEVRKKYGVYIDIKSDMIKDTIRESVEGIGERLISTFDSLENVKIFYEFSYQSNWVSLRGFTEYGIELYVREYGTSNLIYLIRYAKSGTFDKDFKESNEIAEMNKLSSTLGKAHFMIDNISVTSYKNGKVTVHGLSPEAIDRMVNGFRIAEKYRYIGVWEGIKHK